jgi:biopolymer transport protein ExbB
MTITLRRPGPVLTPSSRGTVLLIVGLCAFTADLSAQEVQQKPAAAAPAQPTSDTAPATEDDAVATRPSPAVSMRLLDVFYEGGVLMYPILGCSIVLVAFAVERSIMLRRSRVIPSGFVTRFMEQIREGKLDRHGAIAMCRENSSPVAAIFEHAVRRWGRPAAEIEQAITEGGQREIAELKRNVRVMNSVSTVAPLLGLLGTVLGMITCFAEVASHKDALGKPEALAGGIYVALYTTAFGLSVAIPALITYYYFVGRVERLVGEMDVLAQELVEYVAQGVPEPARPRDEGDETIVSPPPPPPPAKSSSRGKRSVVAQSE